LPEVETKNLVQRKDVRASQKVARNVIPLKEHNKKQPAGIKLNTEVQNQLKFGAESDAPAVISPPRPNVQFGKTVFQPGGPLNHGRNFRAIN
jgi:putative AlgH/UPF0301 family transcriptional regulator